nr:hypothetical protein [Thiorhodococcus mannitoliphagus]
MWSILGAGRRHNKVDMLVSSRLRRFHIRLNMDFIRTICSDDKAGRGVDIQRDNHLKRPLVSVIDQGAWNRAIIWVGASNRSSAQGINHFRPVDPRFQ